MMLGSGYLDQARALLDVAGDLANRNRRDWIERRARQLVDRIP